MFFTFALLYAYYLNIRPNFDSTKILVMIRKKIILLLRHLASIWVKYINNSCSVLHTTQIISVRFSWINVQDRLPKWFHSSRSSWRVCCASFWLNFTPSTFSYARTNLLATWREEQLLKPLDPRHLRYVIWFHEFLGRYIFLMFTLKLRPLQLAWRLVVIISLLFPCKL